MDDNTASSKDNCNYKEDLQQLAYAVSHDMREPLRMIASYLQLIDMEIGDNFDDETRIYMDNAIEGARRLNTYLDGLVEFSRVNTRGGDFLDCDTTQILEDVLLELGKEINGCDAEIACGKMPFIIADPSQLSQLLKHIIGNAVKFNEPSRRARIVIRCNDEQENWVFTISDNGIGMPKDQIPKAFGIFGKLQAKDAYPGCGIGLPVSRRILERHGGKIAIDSTVGEGTVVSFTIPKNPPMPQN